MKHKRQTTLGKNGDDKSSKANSCNNDDDSIDLDLNEGKTSCSDSGYNQASDKASDNESDESQNTGSSPSTDKNKRKEIKQEPCCGESFLKNDLSQQSLNINRSSDSDQTIASCDLTKMYSSTPSSTHLLQTALSSSVPYTTSSNLTKPSTKSPSLPYSQKDNSIILDSVDSKQTPWSGQLNTNSRQVAKGDTLLHGGSSNIVPPACKQIATPAYYGCYTEGDSQSLLSPSSKRGVIYPSGHPSLPRSPSSTNQLYFGYRQMKTSDNYGGLVNYTNTMNKANMVNSYASCNASNGQVFDGNADTSHNSGVINGSKVSNYDYGSNMTEYKNCDYSGSKLSVGGNGSGNMFDNMGTQYGYGENGLNSHLSSPDNYDNYGTYADENNSKYMHTTYYDTSVNVSNSQHRIPSEYNAITLKQEQQLIGGCGYSSLNANYHNAYYENSGNSHIAIASSPTGLGVHSRTPMSTPVDTFTKSSYDHQTPFNAYCDNYTVNQYDTFLASNTEISPEYYQLS